MIKAAIDIGTNTAHILIADIAEDGLSPIYKKRYYTLLAEDGIEIISELAIGRLYTALDDFYSLCQNHNVIEVKVSATEALRKASNGQKIAFEIERRYNWKAEIISGKMEAALVHLGVERAVDMTTGDHLIMDIGGGSVEFIFVSQGLRTNIHSFPLGIAHVYNKIQHSDPISNEDIASLNAMLDNSLSAFFENIKSVSSAVQLIGCAGTFEIFGTRIQQDDEALSSFQIDVHLFQKQFIRILKMSYEERLQDPFIPESRAKYIQVALLLIDYVIKELNASHFVVSKFGLKEGLILSN